MLITCSFLGVLTKILDGVCLGTSLAAQTVKTMQDMQVRSLGWEYPLEKEMATHYSILVWRIHGQRSLVGYSPWGR